MLVNINLLGEKERDRPAFVVAAITLILLGLVSGLVFYFLGNSFENKQQGIAAQSAEVISQQAFIQSQMQTSELLNDTQKLKKTVEWAETYQYDTIPILQELTMLLPERGFFTSFSFSAPNVVNIVVQFDTSREAAFYLTQLKASEMMTNSKLTSLSSQGEEQVDLTETESDSEAKQTETIMPRYTATYDVTFIDTRMPADGTTVPVDPNAPPIEGEVPVPAEGDVPAEGEVQEGTPAETVPDESTTQQPSEQQTPADDAQGDETNE
jgi:type IV pilus assembly protein PilN